MLEKGCLATGPLLEAHIEKIRALFSQLGADKTGVITYAMFEEPRRKCCKASDQGGHPNNGGH